MYRHGNKLMRLTECHGDATPGRLTPMSRTSSASDGRVLTPDALTGHRWLTLAEVVTKGRTCRGQTSLSRRFARDGGIGWVNRPDDLTRRVAAGLPICEAKLRTALLPGGHDLPSRAGTALDRLARRSEPAVTLYQCDRACGGGSRKIGQVRLRLQRQRTVSPFLIRKSKRPAIAFEFASAPARPAW